MSRWRKLFRPSNTESLPTADVTRFEPLARRHLSQMAYDYVRSGGGDEIIRGDVANGHFTTLSMRDSEVVGGVTVNAARDMSVLRRLVASRKTVHRSDLENPNFELKRSLAS